MAEAAPLYFEKRLGGLFPVNADAQQAVSAIDGRVRVRIASSRGNDRRMALYWVVLGIAAPMLSERCEGDALDTTMLHHVLKKRRGLFTTTKLPSGEVEVRTDSISFAKMGEVDRAAYVTWAFDTLSKWLGCSVEALTAEARAA